MRVPKVQKGNLRNVAPPLVDRSGCRREARPVRTPAENGRESLKALASRCPRKRLHRRFVEVEEELENRIRAERSRAYRIARGKNTSKCSRGSDKTRTFFVLDLGLDVVDGVRGLHLKGDGLAGDYGLESERGRVGSALDRAARNASNTAGARIGIRSELRQKNAVCNKTSSAGIGRARRDRAFARRERGHGPRKMHVRVFTKICMVACGCFGARGASKSKSRGIRSNAKLEESTRSSNEIAKRVWRHDARAKSEPLRRDPETRI